MRISELKELKADVWVFDNDGTLYQTSRDIESAVTKLMIQYIAQFYSISVKAAQSKRRDILQKHQTKYTLVALRNEGINENHCIQNTYLAVDLRRYGITINQELRDAISALSGEKFVLTNNPSAFADFILAALGIRDLFSYIFGMQELDFALKPAREAFAVLGVFLAQGKKLVYLDDKPENIKIAKEMGSTTVLVGNQGVPIDDKIIDFWIPSLAQGTP